MCGLSGSFVSKVQLFDGARFSGAEAAFVLFIIFVDFILRDGGWIGNIRWLKLHIGDFAVFRCLILILVLIKISLESIIRRGRNRIGFFSRNSDVIRAAALTLIKSERLQHRIWHFHAVGCCFNDLLTTGDFRAVVEIVLCTNV
ncbi:hypothetical protein D9M68_856040 [compost metagenome]